MEQNLQHKAGDSNQITRDYFDSLLIEMCHIGSVLPSTKFELYGEAFSTPVMTAALSHLNRTSPNGTIEMAKGAKEAGAVLWTGMGGGEELESIAATGARFIKIVKPYSDNDLVYKQIEHAQKCGALAVGMDVDHAFNRKGQYDKVIDSTMSPKTLEEIKSFVNATKLPFIIKGVLSEKDAYKCMEAGVKGMVISHHHGIMDYALPPLMILPKIAKIVDHSMPIFVDCGIMSGIDAFKAIALGATAVCVGRKLLKPLEEEGAVGVQKTIEAMTEELAGAMAYTGSADILDIDPSLIWKRDF